MKTLEVKQNDHGELYIEFPDELLNQVGWDDGDTLLWEELSNGSFLIKKEENENTNNGSPWSRENASS